MTDPAVSIYEDDPGRAPDSEFERGALVHLVPGNAGRLLDARRTPISIVAVHPEIGMFELEIEAFEDKGTHWLIPFEDVGRYQFGRGSARAPQATARSHAEVVERLSQALVIEPHTSERAQTAARIARERAAADDWLDRHGVGRFDPTEAIAKRAGDTALQGLLGSYLERRGLAAMDREFAEMFVSNPRSGETVKGHSIMLAELGLVRFEGKAIRDPRLFEREWSRERRARHIVARLGFAQALWGRSTTHPVLYRGIGANDMGLAYQPLSFVSTTFSHEVAAAHEPAEMLEQRLPVARVFMTFLETEAMNRRFNEAEAVLLASPGDEAF